MFTKMPLKFSPTLRISDDVFSFIKSHAATSVYEIQANDYIENKSSVLVQINAIIEKQAPPKFYILEFGIPSRFPGEHTAAIGHAITAFVDIHNKKIITNDSLYGEVSKSGEKIDFPKELAQSLAEAYPGYEIQEDVTNLQKPGEIICVWLTYVKARYYSMGKTLSRGNLAQEWYNDMLAVNQNQLTLAIGSSSEQKMDSWLNAIYLSLREKLTKKYNLSSTDPSFSRAFYRLFFEVAEHAFQAVENSKTKFELISNFYEYAYFKDYILSLSGNHVVDELYGIFTSLKYKIFSKIQSSHTPTTGSLFAETYKFDAQALQENKKEIIEQFQALIQTLITAPLMLQ
ncbi:hypothetical protein [Legionella brunensis]|uniref:Uncharacterized protein n=1 Tax=Legionella brunensis TaxID=29422 RepID=A0A0W0S468_9GAMM|nr:hypothetical protein [Legionella brunensis]KTC78243.1 hypothetical protein Lbru_2535 [Legionella brunensis]